MTTYTSAAAIKDIQGATYDALKARFMELAVVVDIVSAERKSLADEIKRRELDAAMRARVNVLSRDGKRALREVVNSTEFLRG